MLLPQLMQAIYASMAEQSAPAAGGSDRNGPASAEAAPAAQVFPGALLWGTGLYDVLWFLAYV